MTSINQEGDYIRVLHIGADNIGYGGRSVFAYDLAQAMDKELVHNDFLAFKKIDEKFENEINKHNGFVVYIDLNRIKGSYNKLKKELYRSKLIIEALKENRYDIVHIHADHAYEAMKSIYICKKAGVKIFVVHAHTAGKEKYPLLKEALIKLCQVLIGDKKYTKIACSKEAGLFMFGSKARKKFTIVNDGINSDRFQFKPAVRSEMRKKFGYKDSQIIIGAVGRFSPAKNFSFLLDIFHDLKKEKRYSTSRLLLIGEGPLKESLHEYARKLKIEEYIDFLGNRTDVPDLLQAMDIYVSTSKYEGFGLANVEAQCSGLPCLLSDGTPKNVKVTALTRFIPLSAGIDFWVKAIDEVAENEYVRVSKSNEVINKGFDIRESADFVEQIYKQIIR